MIDLISSLFKEGDAIQIEYGNSNKRVKGTILKIMPSSIALKLDTGGITGISANEITSFDSPDVTVQESQTALDPLSKDAKNDVTEQKEETKELNNIVVPKTDVTSKVPSYKPGDVIPLNELYKIDPKLKRTKKLSGSPKESVVTNQQPPSVPIAVEVKETKNKMSTIGNSFEALAPLVEEQHEIDNLKSVESFWSLTVNR